jgi:hypothetical protein
VAQSSAFQTARSAAVFLAVGRGRAVHFLYHHEIIAKKIGPHGPGAPFAWDEGSFGSKRGAGSSDNGVLSMDDGVSSMDDDGE